MPRGNAGERRKQAEGKVVALLTELMKPPPDPTAKEAVENQAVIIDGLADDILAVDAEGGLLFLADLTARAIRSLGEQTGAHPAAVLETLTRPNSAPPSA
jgi:hypothetical protein